MDEYFEGYQCVDWVVGKGDDWCICYLFDVLGYFGLYCYFDEFDIVVVFLVVSVVECVFDYFVGFGIDIVVGDDQVGVYCVLVKDCVELCDVVVGGCGGDYSGVCIVDGSGQYD